MRCIAIISLLAAAGLGCTHNSATDQTSPDQGAAEIDGQIRAAADDTEGTVAGRALGIAGEHLGVAADALEIMSVEAVNWPDSSLGCPQPGMSYLQVITPGHKVLIRYEEGLVPVHMARGSGFVCESSKASLKNLKPRIHRLPPEQLAELARADLAQRLAVSRDSIQVLSRREVVWNDTSLGCPRKGQDYEEKSINGFVIRLAHQGREYSYHSDQLRPFPCPPVASE